MIKINRKIIKNHTPK